MKKTKIIIFVLSIAAFLVWAGYLYMGQDKNVKIARINGKIFKLELADTPGKRQEGLGQRDSLCPDCAMLFVFPQKGNYSFWMKNMRFDLDMLWILDNKIVYVARNVPHQSLEIINPLEEANEVLEINSGLSDKYGFKIGDEVKVSGIPTQFQ